MKTALVTALVLSLSFAGCATTTTQKQNPLDTVQTIAITAPVLAQQFNAVYAYLVAQKLIPDRTKEATLALAMMDRVAPLVQQGAEALKGDNFNWAAGVLQFALIVAQAMGYILPLVL